MQHLGALIGVILIRRLWVESERLICERAEVTDWHWFHDLLLRFTGSRGVKKLNRCEAIYAYTSRSAPHQNALHDRAKVIKIICKREMINYRLRKTVTLRQHTITTN